MLLSLKKTFATTQLVGCALVILSFPQAALPASSKVPVALVLAKEGVAQVAIVIPDEPLPVHKDAASPHWNRRSGGEWR